MRTFIWSSTLSYRPANICLSQTRHSHSASSSRWLARQRSDPFVRDRAQSDDGAGPYRSRAAFKLLEIQRKYKILRKGFVVVDLGCAPGSWLQVASRAVGVGEGSGRVVGIDLLAVGSIPGVDTIRGDFLDAGTRGHLVKLLESSTSPGQVEEPVVDVVLSDMAANVTGNRTTDVMNTLNLCEAAYVFAAQYLRLGGSHLVMKYFTHPTLQDFKQQYLVPSFKYVQEFKPKASRSESSECYWVCLDWKGVPP